MKTKTKKTVKESFPFIVPRPREMKAMHKVMCMVYQAQNFSLKELRERQDIITQQIRQANKYNLETDDLGAMFDNVCASVAYQQFPDEKIWMGFIGE
jgi:ABC-type glutathione transport system ATPase component